MKKLINEISNVKNSSVKDIIDNRMSELSSVNKNSNSELFHELCFCLMTANFNAERAWEIQKKLKKDFVSLDEKKLAAKLRAVGYRFPNVRAKFIVEARQHKNKLKKVVAGDFGCPREWLAKNVKGLGMKESSHFLRNIGINDYAILDFHIVDLMVEHGLVENQKNRSMTPKKYIDFEKKLLKLGNKVNLSQGELDFYLWYMETGKIIK